MYEYPTDDTVVLPRIEASYVEVKPWWKRPVTWVAAGALILGGAAAMFVLGRPGPVTASSIVQHDGYKVIMTLDHNELSALADNSTDGKMAVAMFDNGAVGTNSAGNEEMVLQETSSGHSLFGNPLFQQSFADGVGKGLQVREQGNFLIVFGAAGDFTSGAGTTTA